MRKDSIWKSTFPGVFACAFAFYTGVVGADDKKSERASIPPTSHFTIATPGSQWMNVSRPLTTDDLRNKIVLLDFWTYCCVNCIHVIPEIAKLEKEFKDDLAVVGVHSAKFDNEKDTDNIRQAVLRYGIEHPVVNDRDFRIWRAFEIRSWPTLVLLQPNGEVSKVFTGEGHTEEIRKAIRDVIKAFPKRSTAKLPIALERERAAKGEFFFPSKLTYDDSTKTLFVADSSHHQIAAYTWDPAKPAELKPSFRIGKGEPGESNGGYSVARFRRPQGILAAKGVLYVADTENHRIRRVDLKSKTVSTIAGTGKQGSVPKPGKDFPALGTSLSSPWDLAFHPDAEHLVIAMAGDHQLWSLDLKSNRLSVIAGTGAEGIEDGLPPGQNTLAQPSGLSSLLGSLYFVDAETSSLRFYFESYVRTLVGTGLFDFGFRDGDRKKALLQHPLGIFADVTGVYIADSFNHSIRRYDPPKQTLETVVGDGKVGEGADEASEDAAKTRLNEPAGITKLHDGLFAIADTNNHRIMLWNQATKRVERMKIIGEKFAPKAVAGKGETNPTVEGVAPAKRISVRLPNTQNFPEAKVNRTTPEIRILLPEGYHLNADAPSFARLFAGAPPKDSLKQEWNREELEKSLSLRPVDLKAGVDYTFQGTFYFCLSGKNAICEIASANFPLHVDPSGTEKVDIALSAAQK